MNKAKMFNKKASAADSKPDEVVSVLKLTKGQVVADIGAGGGYFALRFADAVGGTGRVYAIDRNAEFLKHIGLQAGALKLNNITTMQADAAHFDLPISSIDLIFMRNVTHHIKNRTEYFSGLKKYLKPAGRIAVIDYKKDGKLNFHEVFGHYVEKGVLLEELRAAGFEVAGDFDFLLAQHFLIFRAAHNAGEK